MLFSYEAPKRVKTEKEKQAEVSRLWNPSAADKRYKPTNTLTNEFKRTARSKGTIFKNDTRLYGNGGYKGNEIDTSKFTSGYYEQKEFRESFSKKNPKSTTTCCAAQKGAFSKHPKGA